MAPAGGAGQAELDFNLADIEVINPVDDKSLLDGGHGFFFKLYSETAQSVSCPYRISNSISLKNFAPKAKKELPRGSSFFAI